MARVAKGSLPETGTKAWGHLWATVSRPTTSHSTAEETPAYPGICHLMAPTSVAQHLPSTGHRVEMQEEATT